MYFKNFGEAEFLPGYSRPKIGAGVNEMASSDFERAGRCLRNTSHLLSM